MSCMDFFIVPINCESSNRPSLVLYDFAFICRQLPFLGLYPVCQTARRSHLLYVARMLFKTSDTIYRSLVVSLDMQV